MKENNEWTEVISPKGNLLDLKLGEVWKYRDLIALFVRRDLVAAYKQTILGPTWFIIQPLISSFVFAFIFGSMAGFAPDNVPSFLFYLCSNICWYYFSRCLSGTSATFTGNAGIFGKVYFPRLTSPIATMLSSMIQMGIQVGLFLVVYLFYYFYSDQYELAPNWTLLIVPYLMILMSLLGLGTGIIVSSLTTKYRDLIMFVSFGVQLLMYISAVICPIDIMVERIQGTMPNIALFIQEYAYLNPIISIVENFRFAFFGIGEFDFFSIIVATIVTLVTFFIGVILFNKVERTFMDTV